MGIPSHCPRMQRQSTPPALLRSCVAVTQRPDVCADGGRLFGCELRSSQGGHRAAILFGLRHAVGYRLGDPLPSAIAPQPVILCQIRSEGGAHGVGAMASGACAAGDLAMDRCDLPRQPSPASRREAQEDLMLRPHPRRDGSPPAAWQQTGRWFAGGSMRAGAWSEGGFCGLCSSTPGVGDLIDPALHVVGDVKRTVGTDRDAGGAIGCAPGGHVGSGETVGEYFAPTRG